MLHQRAAHLRAPLHQVHYAIRQSRLHQQCDEPRRNRRRIGRRLQHHRVAADDGRRRHPGHDRQRKVPRRNHRSHAQWNVAQLVALAWILNRRRRCIQSQRLACVKLQKVDALANIRIGLAPVLADLQRQPRAELEVSLAQQLRRTHQQSHALRRSSPAPTRKSRMSRSHGRARLRSSRGRVPSDHLGRRSGVDRGEGLLHPDRLACDDQIVGDAQLRTCARQRLQHGPPVLRGAEVGEGFVAKGSELVTHGCLRPPRLAASCF